MAIIGLPLAVEVAVVAEPGERIRLGQAHRLQRAVHRALVQRNGDERADEGRGEEGRSLPEDGQHEADRGHDREGHDRPVDRVAEKRHERLPRPAGDDAGGEQDVDRVERARSQQDFDEEPANAVVGADDCGRRAGRAAAEGVDRAVVDEPDRGATLHELDGRPRDEADHDRGRPAVDDGGADDEDRGQRDAAGGDALDRDRVGLDEGGRDGQCEHAAHDADRRSRGAERESGGHKGRTGGERYRGQKRKKPGGLSGNPRPHRITRCALGANRTELHVSDLPVPALGLAKERGKDGGSDEQVRQLRLPVQHLISPVDIGRLTSRSIWTRGPTHIPRTRDSAKPLLIPRKG